MEKLYSDLTVEPQVYTLSLARIVAVAASKALHA